MLKPNGLVFLLVLGVTVCAASAVEFSIGRASGKRVTVCRVDLETERLQLFLGDESGRPFKTFDGINGWLSQWGNKLVFGMNAGMYHGNFAPVGLFIQGGRQVTPLNLSNAKGNFFLKPNGVFLISPSGARIVESSQYPALTEPASLATQSGPMLVIGGKIHPAFNPQSESRLFRNGVGVASAKSVYFVISEEQLNLYEFAAFFRDVLRCPDALFLDGDICSLYSKALGRNDSGNHLGPIIGISEKP